MRVNGVINPPKINNSVASKVNNVAISRIGAWGAGGDMGSKRMFTAACGSQTASTVIAGYDQNVVIKTCENYNGTSWSSTGSLANTRLQSAGCGTQSAGLVFGGNDGGSMRTTSEHFNGSTWSNGGNYGYEMSGLGGCGSQSAALGFGGREGSGGGTLRDYSRAYDGSTWSSAGSLNTARTLVSGCGSQSAALSICGYTNSYVKNVESYNGTAWSNENDMLFEIYASASFGVQTSALQVGGEGSGGATANCSFYNGTGWTADANLGTARRQSPGGCGSTAAGLVMGGANLLTTEEYTK